MNPEQPKSKDPKPHEIAAMCKQIRKDRVGRRTKSGMPIFSEEENTARKHMYRLSIPNSCVRY